MNIDVRFALSLGSLSPKHLRVHRFRGREAISELYRYELDVTAGLPPIPFERAVLARRGRFAMRAYGKFRCVHGMVASVKVLGIVPGSTELYRYRVRLVPGAWQLKHRSGSRIFQRERVDKVIDAVAHDLRLSTSWQLEDQLPERAYCTQYEETDWAFVRRLCAENGVLFYFEQPPTVLDEAMMAGIEAAESLPLPLPLSDLATLLTNELAPLQGERLVFTDANRYLPMRNGELADGAATFLDTATAIASELGAPTEFGTDIGPLHFGVQVPGPTLHYRDSGALVGSDDDWVRELAFARTVRPTKAEYREYDYRRPAAVIDEDESLSLIGSAQSALRGIGLGGAADALASGAGQGLASLGAAAAADAIGGLGSRALSALPRQMLSVLQFDDGLGGVMDGLIEPTTLLQYEHHAFDLFPDHERKHSEPKRIMRAHRRSARMAQGDSACIRLEPGHRFTLDGHPVDEMNCEWAVVEVRPQGVQNFTATGDEAPYSNTFTAVPCGVAFVPLRTKRKSVQVCLTATVVGPANEEIHVNDCGEIKVKFHWDRRPDRHDSSCWIRTMQPWAGAGWGFQFIPRIGMEVVVMFEGGDPDKPLVTGSVYNGAAPPPFSLPAQKTISGIRTKSTPHAEGHNELSFEDQAGRERVYLHAQRDQDDVVERNRTALIHHDDHTTVDGDQTLHVKGTQGNEIVGDRTSTMRHDDHLRVEGSRHVSVRQNLDETIYGNRNVHIHERARREVGGLAEDHVHGDLVARVDGNATMIVGKHDALRSATLVVEGPAQISTEKILDLVSQKEVILRCGKSFIRIKPNEIEIASPKVTVRGKDARLLLAKGKAKLKTKTSAQVVSEGSIVLKASGAGIAIESQVKVDGSQILLNAPLQATDNIEIHDPEPTKIELTDQDGRPIPNQRFLIVCDDGSEYMGFVDEHGKAEADIEGSGQISFPDLSDVESG